MNFLYAVVHGKFENIDTKRICFGKAEHIMLSVKYIMIWGGYVITSHQNDHLI